jgi:hypothetical protein
MRNSRFRVILFRKAAYAGLLDGLQGVGATYNFLAPSTRGECAQLLYNLSKR